MKKTKKTKRATELPVGFSDALFEATGDIRIAEAAIDGIASDAEDSSVDPVTIRQISRMLWLVRVDLEKMARGVKPADL